MYLGVSILDICSQSFLVRVHLWRLPPERIAKAILIPEHQMHHHAKMDKNVPFTCTVYCARTSRNLQAALRTRSICIGLYGRTPESRLARAVSTETGSARPTRRDATDHLDD